MQPRFYRASLTFSLSDSVGKPLSIDAQNNIITSLLSQPLISHDSSSFLFSLEDSQKKDFRESLRLSRNGHFIDLTFEAKTMQVAQDGLETWFAALSKEIIKQKQKRLLTEQKTDQKYDKVRILNIVQGFRSSFDSLIFNHTKKTELNDLSRQLTEATLKRIHLTSLNSTISMMREKGQSLLSLSFIANNAMVASLEVKRDLLEAQRAHMAAQLGWAHPQIKAMTAELDTISHQIENKVLQIVHQVHSDEMVAIEFEKQLKEKMRFFVKDQSQSLTQMFRELENKIRAVVDKEIDQNSSLFQSAKIQVIVPTTLTPIPFMALYGKNMMISFLTSVITLLGGFWFFQRYFETKKSRREDPDFKNDQNSLAFKGIQGLETLTTIEALFDFLKYRTSMVISIIGPEAARTAAKLSLHLIKERKTVLLVDISGQKIEKVIGPHRGLSDILTGNAQLQDVIYRDYDTGVDILPQGLTSAVSAEGFSKDIPHFLQEFKKDYDFIILEMADEPKYGSEQFAKLTDYYVSSVALNQQDWIMQMVGRFPKTFYHVVAP
ncbi:MinD-like ATPase involved in chromosome partitioning or flagellar assembly [Bartonella silvatica]|uniref:MinD-like ATPase involved in chromosome partitioning or flagellar assembly n=1 Tax=Bartonella silvatica TaxID=357760 RepID=A0ABV2HGL7_9HYPH